MRRIALVSLLLAFASTPALSKIYLIPPPPTVGGYDLVFYKEFFGAFVPELTVELSTSPLEVQLRQLGVDLVVVGATTVVEVWILDEPDKPYGRHLAYAVKVRIPLDPSLVAAEAARKLKLELTKPKPKHSVPSAPLLSRIIEG